MSEVLSASKFDVYRTITDRIVEAIEAGAGEWVMPWHRVGPASGRPRNASTRYFYKGVNVLALWAEAMLRRFRSDYWASYDQWQRIGGQVRKGERGTTIVFYRPIESPEAANDETEVPARVVARATKVFNEDQVTGWRAPEAYPRQLEESLDQAEGFALSCGALIRIGSDVACYRRDEDLIEIPRKEDFIGSPTSTPLEAYYATLFHEFIHWTGAPWRLKRDFGERFGDEAYAMEELVAELGAAFLCADFEVSNQPRADHAAYVANWLRVLQDDRRAVFLAASKAAEAASYLGCILYPARTTDL